MGLSNELISQFVKITRDKNNEKKETTLNGTTIEYDGNMYVKLDGSDQLTPVVTAADMKSDERVAVLIKNHTATVIGNMSSPAARTEDVEDLTDKVAAAEKVIAEEVIAGQVVADKLIATDAKIENLETNMLTAEKADIKYAKIEELEATKATITDLDTKFLSAESAEIKYANIDFANIGEAAIETLFAKSGLIEDVIVDNGTITGTLVGVTIKGDTIEGNTIVADKLVIKGENGLYYKLNTDGVTTEAEQTEYNSLNGSVITAKSITATQISVSDLVAFDATIGGFNITSDSLYSDVKDSDENTTRGIYFDTDAQVNIGDSENYIRYLRNEDGTYSLSISAESILYALNGTSRSLADLAVLSEYAIVTTYDGQPCIELGEFDSDFKLRITNTEIQFLEGTAVPAYISNQKLNIEKAEIKGELQFGDFVFKKRSNGNMGITWVGE